MFYKVKKKNSFKRALYLPYLSCNCNLLERKGFGGNVFLKFDIANAFDTLN